MILFGIVVLQIIYISIIQVKYNINLLSNIQWLAQFGLEIILIVFCSFFIYKRKHWPKYVLLVIFLIRILNSLLNTYNLYLYKPIVLNSDLIYLLIFIIIINLLRIISLLLLFNISSNNISRINMINTSLDSKKIENK